MQQANSGNLSLHILQKGLLGRGRRRGDGITASLQAHRCQMLCFRETRVRANRVRLSHLPIGCLRCGVLCRCACLLGICDEPGERTGGFAWECSPDVPFGCLLFVLALPVNHQRARVARVTIKCELNIIFFATRPLKLVIQGIQRCSHVRENESD